MPLVLDACCGSRAFWFDKADGRALFVDKRRCVLSQVRDTPRSPVVVIPDIQCDFTNLPLPSDTFALVVFDPPHRVAKEATGNLLKFYGTLNGDWCNMLRKGFAECFRVLRPEGTLVFKWCDSDIPLRKILALTPEKPLFGHKSGKAARTHWVAFLKA